VSIGIAVAEATQVSGGSTEITTVPARDEQTVECDMPYGALIN
jgi:hypothetical protein